MTTALPIVEQIVRTRIRNPQTSGFSLTFDFAGKIDYVYEANGMTILRDWKTCANAEQASRLKMLSYQADLYAVALEDQGVHIDCAEFCLIERPSIKLCAKDASPEDYEERCVEWLRQPGKLAEFRIPSTAERRESARQWLWDISQQIIEARRSGRWVCAESACYSWMRECPYMPLCLAKAQGHQWESILESDYQEKAPHTELDGEVEGGEVLTHSAASMFKLCDAKYHWRYELCIVPRQVEDSDALNNGINVHAGLETACLEGLEAGLAAVNPDVLGIDQKGLQDRAKARAMVRVAFERWGKRL